MNLYNARRALGRGGITERAVIQRARRGDADAFGDLVRAYSGQVHAIEYAILLNDADAEDAMQEAFLRAYERLGQLRDPDHFSSWVARIARSCALLRLRHRRREVITTTPRAPDSHGEDVTDQERFEQREDLRRLLVGALEALPDSLRLPLVMRHMQDASYEDISRALLIRQDAVRRRVKRARERLIEHFRRSGRREDCIDLLRTYGLSAGAVGTHVARLIEGLRGTSPADPHAVSQVDTPMLWGAVGAVALAGLLVGGLWATRWSALRQMDDPAGEEPTWVALTPAISRASAGPPRQARAGRVVLAAGAEHMGWRPWQPGKNPSLPRRQQEFVRSAPAGAVVDSDPGVFRRFEPAEGVVTLEVWMKPSLDEVNAGIGLLMESLDNSSGPGLAKNETNRWLYYPDRGGGQVACADVLAGGHDIKLVYRTEPSTYDLYLDGKLIDADIPQPSHSLVGQAVTGVYVFSGRGGEGAPTYFDDLRVTVEDDTMP